MTPLFRWQSAVDFLVLTAAFYALLLWAQSARALRIALGVVGIHALALLALHLDLVITSWVLDFVAIVAVILLLLIFQPELRRAFMRLDRALRYWPRPQSAHSKSNDAIAGAAFDLAADRIGALLVIVRRDGVFELVQGGVALGAEISAELLKAIFQKTSPLHDGAVVIAGDRAVKAGVVLPLTERRNVGGSHGTRHRAAMGLAERCDAVVAVVSEERGEVTLMLGREILPQSGREELARALKELRSPERKSSVSRVRRVRRALFSNLRLKLGAVGLAGVIWAASFLAAGATIRSVAAPIEFSNAPAGMEVSEQSADNLEIQLRGSPWVMDSLDLGGLIARFDLGRSHPGWNTLQLSPAALDLPPGILVERITPGTIRVRLTRASRPPGGSAAPG